MTQESCLQGTIRCSYITTLRLKDMTTEQGTCEITGFNHSSIVGVRPVGGVADTRLRIHLRYGTRPNVLPSYLLLLYQRELYTRNGISYSWSDSQC